MAQIQKYTLLIIVSLFYMLVTHAQFYTVNELETMKNLFYDYCESGDTENAIELGNKVLIIQKKISGDDSFEYAMTLSLLAYCYNKELNFKKAIECSEQEERIVKVVMGNKSFEYASSLFYLSKYYSYAKQCLEAKDKGQKSLQIFKDLFGEKNENYINALINLSLINSDCINDYISANQALENVLLILKESGNAESLIYSYVLELISLNHAQLGNSSKSLKYINEVLDIKSKIVETDHFSYLQTMSSKALVYSLIGEWGKAINIMNEVKQSNSIKKNESYYINTLLNLARYYSHNGEHLASIRECQLALDQIISDNVQNKLKKAEILEQISIQYGALRDKQKSKEYFNNSFELQKSVLGENHSYLLNTMDSYINTLFGFGDIDNSLDLLQKVLKLKEQSLGKNSGDYAVTLSQYAIILLELGNYKEAKERANEAINILGKGNPETLSSLIVLARTSYYLNNFNESIGFYNRALLNQEDAFIRNTPLYSSILTEISRAYASVGDFPKSYYYLLKSKSAIESILKNRFLILSSKERDAFWNTQNNMYNTTYPSIYYNHFRTFPEFSPLAYDNVLFSKNLLLNASKNIIRSIIESKDTTLIDLFEKLNTIKYKINLTQSNKFFNDQVIFKLEAQADSLDKILTKKSQKYRQSKDELNIKWQDVQKQLKRDEAAIEFVSFDYFNNYEVTDSILYYALVLKKNDSVPTFIPLFEERQLNDLLINSKDQYQLYASRASHTNFNRMQSTVDSTLYYGNKLYNLVWEPLESSLNGIKHIYYSPSGQLNNIAFAAIPTDKKVLLSDKYNLHQVTSTREVLNKSRNILKPKSIALFGGIEYELSDTLSQRNHLIDDGVSNKNKFSFDNSSESTSGFYKLDGTFDEVNSINDNFIKKGYQTYLFTESNASETNFKNLDVASADIIHIATHGFYFPVEKIKQNPSMLYMNKVSQRDIIVQNPLLRSGLILAGANKVWRGDSISINKEDGVLTAQEISQTNLTNTELVVLSACETALGDINGSEGVFGLQRAFKMAGVKSLIVSLWKVPDKETSQMMQAFYYYWLNGMTKYDAFKKAQNEIRIIRPDPYYWAAFVLID